jgi:putative hemolysin
VDVALQMALVAMLLAINAVLAGSEIALVSLRESQIARLEGRGSRGRAVARLASDPNRFLATIQIGITLSGFLASATAAVALAEPLVPLLSVFGAAARPVAIVSVTAALTFVTLVLGELAPKRIAMQRAERWLLATGGVLVVLARLAGPFVRLLGVATDLVVRLSGADPKQGRDALTQEEIRDLIATGGLYDVEERRIITGALEAADRVLYEVLRPRNVVVALQADLPASEGLEQLIASGHSRAPVYSERIDDADRFVGVMDLVGADGTVAERARPVLLLPESLGLIDALRRLQASRNSLAVVIDEYGGVAGIVTIEDLLEELVGEIHDEYDRDVRDVVHGADGTVGLTGRFPLHDLVDVLPDVPTELLEGIDAVTVAGLITDLLGRLPRSGDEVRLGPLLLRVDAMAGRTAGHVTIRTETQRPSTSASES